MLCVISILSVVSSGEKTTVRMVEARLSTKVRAFKVHKELREARLRGFSNRIGSSQVGAVLEVLADYSKQLVEVDRFICDEKTGIKCDMVHPQFNAERSKKVAVQFGATLFAELSEKLAIRFKDFHPEWTAKDIERVKAENRRKLIKCFGRGSAQCDWSFTYEALCGSHAGAVDANGHAKELCAGGVLSDLRKEQVWPGGHGSGPDLVLVFDSKGIGIANAQNSQWSSRSEFTDLVDRLRKFVLRGSNKGVIPAYYELLEWEDGEAAVYLVAIVPLVSPKGEFLGAVLTGESISGKMVASEKRIFADDITYIVGDKPLASTMNEVDYKHFLSSANVARRLKAHSANSDKYFALSVPYFDYPGNAPKGEGGLVQPTFLGGVAYGPKYQNLRVVVATARDDWLQPFDQLKTMIPVFGAGIFLVGVILIFFLIRNFIVPYELIDAGIHEVCSGNSDYQFPFDYNDDAASAMAQSLNLMMAVLLGKPLPEDQDDEAEWDEGARWTDRRLAPSGNSGRLVIEDDVAKDKLDAATEEMLAEPSEAYYRRLYEEYRGANRDAGQPDDALTYVRFVEYLAKSERDLKERFECSHVHFAVQSAGGQVSLRPVAIA
ncbi:MAG TPA: hypothetical protein EYN66_00845 [Myxococcales bacterium]|nr:hypothetical protein [Myxococcales bacterium]